MLSNVGNTEGFQDLIPTLKSLSLVGKDEIQIQDTNGSSWPARLSTARRVLWFNMDEELTATDHAVSRRHEPTLHFAISLRRLKVGQRGGKFLRSKPNISTALLGQTGSSPSVLPIVLP